MCNTGKKGKGRGSKGKGKGKGRRMGLFMAVLALLSVSISLPAVAATHDYTAEVYSWDGDMSSDGRMILARITSGITFKVLAINTDTSETLTYYGGSTSLTNPVSTTNFASDTVCADRIRFRTDPTDSTSDRYVDLIVVDTAGGYTAFIEDFDYYTHSIILDERPNIQHSGMIWFGASDNTETDTGIDFDYDTLLEHVGVEVVTVDANETIDVGILSTGTNGDADGLVDGASVATAGHPLITLTTSGALMDDGTNFDPDGHVILSANEQSLTYTGSAGSDTAAGYIHFLFTRLR